MSGTATFAASEASLSDADSAIATVALAALVVVAVVVAMVGRQAQDVSRKRMRKNMSLKI